MVKKFNEFVNESVRSLMKPKSEKELQIAYSKLIKKINNPTSNRSDSEWTELKKIRELFRLSIGDLHVVSEHDSYWNELDDYFERLVTNSKKIVIRDETIKNNTGDWNCYPDKKLAKWIPDIFDDSTAWIFCKKDYIKND